MSTSYSTKQQTQGDIVLERVATLTLPATVKPAFVAFKSAHAGLVAASKATESARTDRDDALTAVGTADDALDVAVLLLADKMTGAQLGNRKNAFANVSKYAPGAVTELPYADEVKEVLALTAKVKKAKPPADVAKAAASCEKLANAVTSALSKLSKPQLAFSKSLAARDALLPGWTKALSKLKKSAEAAWFDEPGTYKGVFAAPDKVQAPVHKKAKKKTVAAPVVAAPASVKPPTT